jgi:hypothetical protein
MRRSTALPWGPAGTVAGLTATLPELDRLLATGAITGYTIEPDTGYLRGEEPVVTYSMFERDATSRRNLRLLAAELRALGARVELVRRQGSWIWHGRVCRAADVMAIGWFPSPRQLEPAVATIRRRYTAGAAEAVAGSLLVPDVRVCGAAPRSTIVASAHELAAADGCAAIVLDLQARPPLHGMITRPVRVLPCWAEYLASPSPTGVVTTPR